MLEARLGGIALDHAGLVGWNLTVGVQAHIRTFEMHRSAQEVLFAKIARESKEDLPFMDLQLRSDSGKDFTVKKLLVLGPGNASTPHTRGVIVADRRWLWGRVHIYGRFNERRRTGNRRRVSGRLVPLEISDEQGFRPGSLKNRVKKWTPEEVVDLILGRLVGKKNFEKLPRVRRKKPFENLFIDEDGQTAMARILGRLPGISLYPDYNGKIRFTDLLDQSEFIEVVSKLGPEVVAGSQIRFDTKEFIRPRGVRVLFTREIEVRFDTQIDGQTRVITDRVLRPVYPLPDPTLGRFTQGEWLPFTDASLAFWPPPGPVPTLTLEIIRQGYFFDEIIAPYITVGAEAGDATVDWAARISTVLGHFRSSYQIPKIWLDAFMSWIPRRVAVIDLETRRFASSEWFSDYCVAPSVRLQATTPSKQKIWYNVRSWSESNFQVADARPAPAEVRIADAEIGIIRARWSIDPVRSWLKVYPSAVQGVPDLNPSNRARNRADKRVTNSKGTQLEPNHRAAMIITAVPAFPNDATRFHIEERDARESQSLLDVLTQDAALGPVIEVRVPPTIVTARFAWSDTGGVPAAVDAAFDAARSASKVGTTVAPAGSTAALDKQLINKEEIEAVADAVAAGVYTAFGNRWEGVATDVFRDLRPSGSVTSIQHTLSPGTGPRTKVVAPPIPGPVDWIAILDDSVRRAIFKEVQPK